MSKMMFSLLNLFLVLLGSFSFTGQTGVHHQMKCSSNSTVITGAKYSKYSGVKTGYCDKSIACVCDSCPETNYTCFTTNSCVTTLIRSSLEEEGVIERGCVQSYGWLMTTCEYPEETLKYDQYVQHRCCEEDYCNENVTVVFPPPLTTPSPTTTEDEDNFNEAAMTMGLLCGLIFVVFILGVLIYKFLKRRKETAGKLTVPQNDVSSGGSGLRILTQRTIARQIKLLDQIGSGRFGQVYRAEWNGEDVAVKIFHSTQDGSWNREVELYQTTMLRHENILGFIASDVKDFGIETELYLVTDYHKNGSLYDYLQKTTLDVPGLLRLAHSAARGLAHLHRGVLGAESKPAIAHRDIKSRNILVKDDGTCAIADLGLAVRKKSQGLIDVPTGTRVGTSRYMAPEFLQEQYTVTNFQSYELADVYSFGLVLWEMTRRCVTEGVCEEYQLPYYNKVQADPRVEEVYEVVCVEKYRPLCLSRWKRHPMLNILTKRIKECWKDNPCGRLTSLRICKSLKRYLDEVMNDQGPTAI